MPRVVIALCFVAAAAVGGCGESEDELPEMLVVREFELTDHRGARFASDSLRGNVVVVSFVFTSCRDVCPLITNQVANLHRRVVDDDVRFVSISVDPEVDTPAVLAEYAARYEADERWTFLTGDPAAVRRVITESFRVGVGDRQPGGGGYDIAHAEQLMLIDRAGVLRGQYETDRPGMERLERDLGRL